MRISKIIAYLQGVLEREGDIRLADITGFWTRHNFETNEPILYASVGDGLAVGDLVKWLRASTQMLVQFGNQTEAGDD
jgi:hypothetical protein